MRTIGECWSSGAIVVLLAGVVAACGGGSDDDSSPDVEGDAADAGMDVSPDTEDVGEDVADATDVRDEVDSGPDAADTGDTSDARDAGGDTGDTDLTDTSDVGDTTDADDADGGVDPASNLWGCGPNQWRVVGTDGTHACVCLPAFTGDDCDECADGYAGEGCTLCEEGYLRSDRAGGGFDPVDPGAGSAFADPSEVRCVPVPNVTCADLDCGDNGRCLEANGEAACQCQPGYGGRECQTCAPPFVELRDGSCGLDDACGDALCGGLGDCVVDAGSSDVRCECTNGSSAPDCDRPRLRFLDADGRETVQRSMYPGESMVVELPIDPAGGSYTLRPYSTELTVTPCDPRGCPGGGDLIVTVDPDVLDPDEGIDFLWVDIGGPGPDPPPPEPRLPIAVVPLTALPITGEVHPELAPFYENMLTYMVARGIRSGVMGISRGGTELTVNGFGYRDAGLDSDPWEHAQEGGPGLLTRPDTPFRLASLTKPITGAVVIDRMLDRGLSFIDQDQGERAGDFIATSLGYNPITMTPPVPYSTGNSSTDNRWSGISVGDLLRHEMGYFRDVAHNPTSGALALGTNTLPGTQAPGDPMNLQIDRSWLWGSNDVAFHNMYSVSALGNRADPLPTVDTIVQLISGVAFDYNPGQSQAFQNDAYSNFAYMLLGRVAEGMDGIAFDADEGDTPQGWGSYPFLVEDYLCPFGISSEGIFPGDSLRPRGDEPYYRALDANGDPLTSWIVSDRAGIRWNAGGQFYEFCQESDIADCGDPGASWGVDANGLLAYGGFNLASINSAGGLVADAGSYLRFMREHRIVRTTTPMNVTNSGGSRLAGPGQNLPRSTHNGMLPGTYTWALQLGGETRQVSMPNPNGVWDPDLPASPPTGADGLTVVNESLQPAYLCSVPDNVNIVVMFNQSDDYRAPNGAISMFSNSGRGAVYGRIRDFMYDAACQIDAANDWPVYNPGNVLYSPPVCE